MRLFVTNDDDRPFVFTAALHTYFRVADIANVVVEGLGTLPYTQFGQNDVQTESQLTIRGEVDRVYWNVPEPITLREGDQTLRIEQDGFADAVVWNPGKDKGDELTDLEPNGYRRMLCIEAVALGQPVALDPTGTWQGSQTITAVP
jgi:glucose-6-phosphate 1-epimerase